MIIKGNITGERIYFRSLTASDATHTYKEWLNHPKVNQYLETRNATLESLKAYISEKNKRQDCLFLGVFDKSNDAHIGNLKLEPIDKKEKKATFSILIGDMVYWGKGIGTEATDLIVDYAFNKLGMDVVDLGVISENKPAIRVYEKVGFRVRTIEKNKMKHGNRYYDKVVMEITKNRFQLQRHGKKKDKDNEIRFLVVGCGSIGKRHIKNLTALGYHITVYDIDQDALDSVVREYGVSPSANLKTALQHTDALIICTPPHLHVSFALAALRQRNHVFIEKPLSHSLKGTDALARIVEKKACVFHVGFNLRHHPVLKRARGLLDSKALGKLYHASIEYGSYLPSWRPEQDYRKNYAAYKSMGGGIILDDIHEIDYALWFFGIPKKVFCSAQKISDLDIETEDTADMILFPRGGMAIAIHMDYLQSVPTRTFRIIGSNGLISGDLNKNVIRAFTRGEWKEEKFDWDPNTMYVDEIKAFITAILTGSGEGVEFKEAMASLKTALALKKSSSLKKVISL